MCIAILTTPGKILDEAVFRRCWRNNQDGFGMAWVHESTGEVMLDKGWLAQEGALKGYMRIAEQLKNADRPMLLHFRAATVGQISADNCHPFKVKGGAMIHNGTFWRDNKASKSDSQQLAEIMHNQLHYANLTKNKERFQDAFGYNRVAFLFKEGKYVIFSEHFDGKAGKFGQWKDGIWYSNGGWHGQYGGNYGEGGEQMAMLDDDEDYAAWLMGGTYRGANFRLG